MGLAPWILPGASWWGETYPAGIQQASMAVCLAVPVCAFLAQVLHEGLGHRAEVDVCPPSTAAALQWWVPFLSQLSPLGFRADRH